MGNPDLFQVFERGLVKDALIMVRRIPVVSVKGTHRQKEETDL